MKKLLTGLDEHFEEWLLLILLALISCVMMLQVIMRFVFKNALPWPEEFCRYCFVYTGFISIPYTIKRGIGIKVDVLYQLFPNMLKKFLNFFYEILQLLFYAYLFYSSFAVVRSAFANGSRSSALQIPIAYIYIILPIGFGLASLRLIQKLIYLALHRGEAQVRTVTSVLEEGDES